MCLQTCYWFGKVFSQASIWTNAFYSKISLLTFQVNGKEILFVLIENNLEYWWNCEWEARGNRIPLCN